MKTHINYDLSQFGGFGAIVSHQRLARCRIHILIAHIKEIETKPEGFFSFVFFP